MNDLESLIRSLPLQVPPKSLDDRIGTMLSDTMPGNLQPASTDSSPAESPQPLELPLSSIVTRRKSEQNIRRSGLASVAAPIAGVCLIFGVILGRLSSVDRLDGESGNRPFGSTAEAGQLFPTEQNAIRSAISHDATCAAGSTIPVSSGSALQQDSFDGIEQNELTNDNAASEAASPASQRAALWELRTGLTFHVATHVSDRRFDACRECHRAGG